MIERNLMYSRYIHQMLVEYGVVSIPEMGTFYLKRTSAFFGENRSKIYPPRESCEFKTHVDSESLLNVLMVESGFQENHVQTVIDNFKRDFYQSIQEKGNYHLPYLGTFADGHFVVENEENFNKYALFPVIDIAPISISDKAGYQVQHSVHHAYAPLKVESKVKDNYVFPIIVAILALSVLILRFIPNEDKKPETQLKKEIVTSDTIAPSPMSEKVEPIQDTTTHMVSEDLVQEPQADENTSEPSKETDDCVVYVGTFEKPDNVSKMVNKISNNGYHPYTESYQSYTRVGIQYDCRTMDSDSFKDVIRKQIEKDAWVK